MNKELDNRELEKRIGLLMKDCQIKEANIDGTLNKMRAENNDLRADFERRQKDIERVLSNQTKWIVGVGVAIVIIIIGVLG